MNNQLVHVLAEIFAVNAEIEAMKVANIVAALQGGYPVWTSDDFVRVANTLQALGQQAVVAHG